MAYWPIPGSHELVDLDQYAVSPDFDDAGDYILDLILASIDREGDDIE